MSGSDPVGDGNGGTVLDLLLARAADEPTAELLLEGESWITCGEFVGRAAGVAAALRDAGCEAGDSVGLLSEEAVPFFLGMVGAWLNGATAVPLNVRLPAAQRDSIVRKARLKFVVAAPKAPAVEVPIVSALAEPRAATDPKLPGDHRALMLFTSGTTGRPKGACISLDAITRNALAARDAVGIGREDRILINTPPYYTSGICHFLTLAASGGSFATDSGFFFGSALLERMDALRCTGFGGAPAHLVRVVDPLETPHQSATMRFWISSGDHLPLAVLERAQRMLPGIAFFNMYGLTEVAGRLCVLPPEDAAAHRGSVGRPVGGMSVRVLDPDGAEVPAGEIGEIHVSGPMLMEGYFDEPELNAACMTERGFRTGDFGRLDDDGFVYVRGRKDDIFQRGGEKVSVIQVQQALLTLDGVRDAACLALEDPFVGRVPVGVIVPDEGHEPNRRALLRALRKLLPPVAIPARIEVVDAIPRTGSGKVVRQALRELVEQHAS